MNHEPGERGKGVDDLAPAVDDLAPDVYETTGFNPATMLFYEDEARMRNATDDSSAHVFPDDVPPTTDADNVAGLPNPPLWYSLVRCLPAWRTIGAPLYLLNAILYGVFVPMLSVPSPFRKRSKPLTKV